MTTYSISLDDVDLALLPLRTHKYNDFLKKEHYQFQVMTIDKVEEPEPTVLYTCHICAVQVPAAFAREHAASVKHRANARIASEAAQRTRALITALPPPHANQPSARYCANCSTLVGKNHDETKEHRVAVMHDKLLWDLMTAYIGDNDKANSYEDSEFSDNNTDDLRIKEGNGYRSQACNGFGKWNGKSNSEGDHQKKFVSTLAVTKLETDKKEAEKNEEIKNLNQDHKDNNAIETRIETDKKEAEKNEEIENLNQDHKDNNAIETRIETDKKEAEKNEEIENLNQDHKDNIAIETWVSKDKSATTIEIVKKELDNKNEVRSSEVIDIETERKEHNVNNCDKTEITTNGLDLTTSGKPKTQDDIKIEYFEFVRKDNKQVKVFSDHYHSFTRKVDTISCIVCSSTFGKENANSHIFSLKHLNKMPSTLIDEHCVRKINDVYSHCIICNQLVKNTNVAKHCLTVGHNQREKQALTENTNYNQATTSKIDKNANLDAAQRATTTVNGDIKVKSQPNAAEKANPTGETKSSIDWPVIYPYEVTKQENTVRCVICDCQVPKNPENRKSHLVGQNHAKNVKNKREVPRASTSKQATPAPAQVAKPAAFNPTFDSASDSIRLKSSYYFSWV